MTALEVVLFGKDDEAFFAVIKVPGFQIAPHVANLPRMRPMPEFQTERVHWSPAEACGVELWVRRLDLAHPLAPGNKAWKLQYHLEKAMHQPSQAILTFGGAWSNHLHATAAMGAELGLRTIGVVRATAQEIEQTPTPTLRDCQDFGMEIFPVSREEYREKEAPFFKAWLRDRFGNPWIIPEGAGDALGVMGCQSLVTADDLERPWDAVVVSAGTGATAAGLAIGLKGSAPLYVGTALKGVRMEDHVQRLLTSTLYDEHWARELMQHVHVWNNAHAGGFGRIDEDVKAFIEDWESETKIPLDGVYTGKSLMRLRRFLEESQVFHGQRILFIHTGGLQGNRSWR
jgi:1-aminocyclopropane-1-carboxylate deaminase